MSRRPPLSDRTVERVGTLNLPLGGKHGYVGVRKVRQNKYQGYTPKKTLTTRAFKEPQEAAIELARLKQSRDLGLETTVERASRAPRALPGALLLGPLPLPSQLTPICCVRVACRSQSWMA